jgi:hypothetical protein
MLFLRRFPVKLTFATIGVCSCFARVDVLLAQNPKPWTRHTIDASSLGADGVRAADVNGDGLMDLVTSWEQGGVTRVYLQSRRKPGVPAWETIAVGKSPDAEDAVLHDGHDGDLDIISSTEGDSRRILVHWAPPVRSYPNERAWTTDTLYADGSQWMFAVPMDVDRRRGIDLIVGGKNERASIGWLESPADPRNAADWKFHRLSDAGWVMSLIIRDMNGDAQPDVLLSDRFGPLAGVRWLENPGPNAAAIDGPWKNHWIGGRERAVMLIDTVDLDGDGVHEIVAPPI